VNESEGIEFTDIGRNMDILTNLFNLNEHNESNIPYAPFGWSTSSIRIFKSNLIRIQDATIFHAIHRVSSAIVKGMDEHGYFELDVIPTQEIKRRIHSTSDDVRTLFYQYVAYLLVTQRFSFNSPVWFNAGLSESPQMSACFIQSVEDTMESINQLAVNEINVYRRGSGTGTNYSNLRSRREPLSNGGFASGPCSFIDAHDRNAKVTKSGGSSRRAAKMVILDVDHPEIEQFVELKTVEEDKARTLVASGRYDTKFNSSKNAMDSLSYQNGNHSIRLTDAFMTLATEQTNPEDMNFALRNRASNTIDRYISASSLLNQIAFNAHACGDPGVQFDDTINNMRTVEERIDASNPCSEYMFVNDSACNLASFNLVKYYDSNLNAFDWESYKFDIGIAIIAMDAIVSYAGYPTEAIRINSLKHRPLGLGFANLGALLLSAQVGYGTHEGRLIAATLMSTLTMQGYMMSSKLGNRIYLKRNEKSLHTSADNAWLKSTVESHYYSTRKLRQQVGETFVNPTWSEAFNDLYLPNIYAIRNRQISVLAPTGTISLAMGCETSGCEPYMGFKTTKALVTGEDFFSASDILNDVLVRRYGVNATFNDIPSRDKAIFATANGAYPLSVNEHIDMLAALQPFVSGAISKTVNLPHSATVEDIKSAIIHAWKSGVKAAAFYRDGSKVAQPLTSTDIESSDETFQTETIKYSVGNIDVVLDIRTRNNQIVGFIVSAGKIGSPESANELMSRIGTLAIEAGVPVEKIASMLSGHTFGESGWGEGKYFKSIPDSVGHYLMRAVSKYAKSNNVKPLTSERFKVKPVPGKLCSTCNTLMIQSGTCHTCPQCGTNSGGCS
jgi:ribonucleoside-diphosphate reductase alpha chain